MAGRLIGCAARLLLGAAALAACGAAPPRRTLLPLASAADEAMIPVPGGSYVAGSTPAEREQAYADAARTTGDDRAWRGRWFDREEARHTATLPAFLLDRTPVTQAAYAEYVRAEGLAGPAIDEAAWRRQGFRQDYAREVARFNWRGASPPPGRDDHPVVLVTHAEARAYCAWRGRRLPSAAELEKAMRGPRGSLYPWGDAYDPTRLNGADGGPNDTVSVEAHPAGAGPHGHLGLAGNVFQWTSTPWPFRAGDVTVKGSAWDDHAGVGRGAQRHGRPARARHVLVGFRCAGP